jgi:hypothetical protein
VRPDDVIRLEGEVVELTPSRSKPQGIVRVKWTAFNQRAEPVYTFTPIGIGAASPGLRNQGRERRPRRPPAGSIPATWS